MSQYLEDFIEFFNLEILFGSDPVTVQQLLGVTIVGFIGSIFTIIGIRCVFELVKIVTDWSKFK